MKDASEVRVNILTMISMSLERGTTVHIGARVENGSKTLILLEIRHIKGPGNILGHLMTISPELI
jgi:hypothetical protein